MRHLLVVAVCVLAACSGPSIPDQAPAATSPLGGAGGEGGAGAAGANVGGGGSSSGGAAGAVSSCGDGAVGFPEACDGSVPAEITCATVVGPTAVGVVGCTAQCQLDTSGCTPDAALGPTAGLQPGAAWPTLGRSPTHAARTATAKLGAKLVLGWSFKLPAGTSASPVIDKDGVIYVGDDGGHFTAVESTGVQRWSFQLCIGDIASTASIGVDGALYVGCRDKRLYAVSPAGAVLWSYGTTGAVMSSPTVRSDRVILVPSEDGVLHAVSPNGESVWKLGLGKGGDFSASVAPALAADDTAYLPGLSVISDPNAKKLYAVDAAGKIRWSTIVDEALTGASASVGADGGVFIKSAYGALTAVDPLVGAKRWVWPSLAGRGLAVGADGTLYFGLQAGLGAVAPNGAPAWTTLVESSAGGLDAPAIDRVGTLAGGGWDAGSVYLVSASGTVLDVYSFVDPAEKVFSRAAIAHDGTLLVTTTAGRLLAFAP